ncbi:hypothetical protein FQA39_LY14447 [Lamprigera yunnana]|nr:hypothetical protein FQA39_LY14447 [Lamprigera yunnana]
MSTSSLCEYCYCIGGQQTCIKPKCLLSLDGCTPIFEKHNCCPVRYNCTGFYTSTTTEAPKTIKNQCIVAGVPYSEGSKISGFGNSRCDNCYCIRGLLRCEPLSCAPAILGCTPVIKPDECCPESYNCSSTFNSRPPINYGNHPLISKEYAKLRKEMQKLSPSDENSNNTVYVVAQSTTKSDKTLDNIGTTRHLQDPSTTGPFYYNTMSVKRKFVTKPESVLDVRTRPSTVFKKNASAVGISFGTTNYEFQNTSYKRPLSTRVFELTTPKLFTSANTLEETTKKQLRSSDYNSEIFDIVESLFDNEIKQEVPDNVTKTEQNSDTTNDPALINLTDVLSTLISTLSDDISTTSDVETSTQFLETTTNLETTKLKLNSTAVTAVVTTTDCIKHNHTKNIENTEATSFATTENDYTEVDLESKVKVGTITPNPYKKLSSDIEAILNITMNKNKDYEDYDYSEPTLPPSLPNLRIIPFVAADALDTKNRDPDNALYPDRITEEPTYSLFSPPTKTEGGFVPKEPPIMPEYYDKNVVITSTTLPPRITNVNNCIVDGREVSHRDTITLEECTVCVCFYGNTICQQPPCLVPEPGCSMSRERSTSCCPHIICDRIDITSSPQEIITITRNPLRDIIHTPSPVEEKLATTQQSITEQTQNTTNSNKELSFNSVLELLLYGTSTTTENVTKILTTTETSSTESAIGVDPAVGVGLLKLAGCNIYGRMYRVGRIISELSGPCMECRCTEVGVQCTPLKC